MAYVAVEYFCSNNRPWHANDNLHCLIRNVTMGGNIVYHFVPNGVLSCVNMLLCRLKGLIAADNKMQQNERLENL